VHTAAELAILDLAALFALDPPATGTADPASVLVVDDDPDIRDLIGTRLWRAGYRVSVAADGSAALELVDRRRPDLVVLDEMMPGPSGLEVCRRLRDDPHTRDLPVLMVSAVINSTFLVEGEAAGANAYLAKPFSGRELLGRVRSLLER
jgi:DNA-binding response OmpR family regulator